MKRGTPWLKLSETRDLAQAFARAQKCMTLEPGIFVETSSGGFLYWTSLHPDLFNSTVLKTAIPFERDFGQETLVPAVDHALKSMNPNLLVEAELSRHAWPSLRCIDGAAHGIPEALRSLFSARSAAEGENAYWRLENHVVVQGQLFEAAVATTHVLMAALVDARSPDFVRTGIIELLFQITSGESHESEATRGLLDLGDRCRSAVREGLWLLYRELVERESDGARELIAVIDPNPNRLGEVERLMTGG